jgi:hypothetical protein
MQIVICNALFFIVYHIPLSIAIKKQSSVKIKRCSFTYDSVIDPVRSCIPPQSDAECTHAGESEDMIAGFLSQKRKSNVQCTGESG